MKLYPSNTVLGNRTHTSESPRPGGEVGCYLYTHRLRAPGREVVNFVPCPLRGEGAQGGCRWWKLGGENALKPVTQEDRKGWVAEGMRTTPNSSERVHRAPR